MSPFRARRRDILVRTGEQLTAVSFMEEELMEAVVVGLEEVEAVRQDTKVRLLRAVPRPPVTPREAARHNADAERAADAKAEAALAELTARVRRLHARNVVSKPHRLRAVDQAELARLARVHEEDRAELFAAGVGAAALVLRPRSC